jgi:hypothetical protein
MHSRYRPFMTDFLPFDKNSSVDLYQAESARELMNMHSRSRELFRPVV